jgi:hypothetical protein
MKKLRTRDKVAIVIAGFTALSVAQDGGVLGVVLAVVINVAIVYGVAELIGIFKRRR